MSIFRHHSLKENIYDSNAASHEFLGPMPHVAGFRFSENAGTARIEWWDAKAQVKWVGQGSWENEIYFDENVRGWVSKLRGDFSRNLDMTEYAGCD